MDKHKRDYVEWLQAVREPEMPAPRGGGAPFGMLKGVNHIRDSSLGE